VLGCVADGDLSRAGRSLTALYVKIDDEWGGIARLPGRPPKLSHSELLCLAVMQAMLGFHGEARGCEVPPKCGDV
jgi:hypothetical protein